MKAVRTHIREDWMLLYIERWLVAPFETTDGVRVPRTWGTAQGGVVSPILMNRITHSTDGCTAPAPTVRLPAARMTRWFTAIAAGRRNT